MQTTIAAVLLIATGVLVGWFLGTAMLVDHPEITTSGVLGKVITAFELHASEAGEAIRSYSQ